MRAHRNESDDFAVPPLVGRPNPTPAELELARFLQFHRDNPHVAHLLARGARRYLAATGFRKVGVRLLWERLRWDVAVRTVHLEGDVKLNDHMTAYFVRLIDARCPDLRGKFDTRRAPWADQWAATLEQKDAA